MPGPAKPFLPLLFKILCMLNIFPGNIIQLFVNNIFPGELWKQQKSLHVDGTWQTKGRYWVWNMVVAERASLNLANKGRFGKWKQQKRLDGTWQTKGRYLVWKMEAAEKASLDLANKDIWFVKQKQASQLMMTFAYCSCCYLFHIVARLLQHIAYRSKLIKQRFIMEAVDRRTSEKKNVIIVGSETYTLGNGALDN